MPERPYLLVSCAMSVDGRIDDASQARLILSGDADLDRVDEVRAGSDAIMVGAATIRRDDPRLVIRSAQRRARRVAAGLPEDPVKVTLTATGDLDPAARFFTAGDSARLVYCARPALTAARARLSGVAEVIDAGDQVSLAPLLKNLAVRGVARLLVEGGGRLATEILTAGLADELHLAVAPFFVGDPAAPRFAGPGHYPHGPANRMRLAEVRQLDDTVLLRYLLAPRNAPSSPAVPDRQSSPASEHQPVSAGEPSPRRADDRQRAAPGGQADDLRWLRETIELSKQCPPSPTAFSVGAVIVGADGSPLATGFSRESDPRDHAEEAALAKLQACDSRLAGATIYSSLEPCGVRASRPHPCAELIIAARLRRAVYAWQEPPLLAPGGGALMLRAAGISVTHVPALAAEARAVNAHLTGIA